MENTPANSNYTMVAAVMTFLAASTNAFLLMRLHSVGQIRPYIFNFNMAVADFILSVFKGTFHLADIIHGGHWGGTVLMRISGIYLQTLCVTSIISVAFMPIDPYRIVISRKGPLSNIAVKILIGLSWLVPLVIGFVPIFYGDGNAYQYSLSGLYVVVDLSEQYKPLYQILFPFNLSLMLLVPIFVYGMCWFIITRLSKIHYSTNELHERGIRVENAVARRSRLLVASHILTWLGAFVLLVFELATSKEMDLYFDVVVYLITCLGFCINPIVCFILNPDLLQKYV